MAKISHFEVYTNNGEGWKLLSRFNIDQRALASNLTQEKEAKGLGVKIIKETFDTSDNSYIETVEYISNKRGHKKQLKEVKIFQKKTYKVQGVKEKINSPKLMQALLILVSIIIISIIIANFLATLLLPILEILFPENVTRTIFFICLFGIFLLIAIPLMLKRMPWQDLIMTSLDKEKTDDSIFISKAENIIERYSLNDDAIGDLTPIFPEADIEYKKEVVNFLAQVLSVLSINTVSLTSFNKLGLKLMIYGACLEFAKYNKLYINQANSLLQEAFTIIDGQTTDLIDFYEAKRSYSDNKIAVFLTGVGAYLMGRSLLGQSIDKDLLIKGFTRWSEVNKATANDIIPDKESIKIANIVSIKTNIKFFDNTVAEEEKNKNEQIEKVKNIIYYLMRKYDGSNPLEKGMINTISFSKLSDGITFSQELLKNMENYIFELNDENIIFNIKITLIKDSKNNEEYIDDIFDYANDDEILTTIKIVQEMPDDEKNRFSSIGTKLLNKTGKKVELFKIV